MARCIRVACATMLAAALLTPGLLAASAGPAAADQPLCNLLPILCPTTTVRPSPATTATTKPSVTTPAPVTTATTKAAAKAAKTTPTTTRAAGTLTVGVGSAIGLPAGIDPASLSQSLPAAAAPELATGTATAGAQTTTSSPPIDQPLPAALGVTTGAGMPNRHTTARILLSFAALGIAGLAVAQLPASRRRSRRDAAVDGLDAIDGL